MTPTSRRFSPAPPCGATLRASPTGAGSRAASWPTRRRRTPTTTTSARWPARAVLDASPARPGARDRGSSRRPPRVLVCYASGGGTTARGVVVTVLPIAKVGAREWASADVVVVGTWVEGFVVAGVGPSRSMSRWLGQLPRLGGKWVAVFCTFSVAPKDTLASMRCSVEAAGATVVAQAAFGPRERGSAGGAFQPRLFGEELARLITVEQGASVTVS